MLFIILDFKKAMDDYENNKRERVPIQSRPGVYANMRPDLYPMPEGSYENGLYIPKFRMNDRQGLWMVLTVCLIALILSLAVIIPVMLKSEIDINIGLILIVFIIVSFVGYMSFTNAANDVCRTVNQFLMLMHIILNVAWITLLFGFQDFLTSRIVLLLIIILALWWIKILYQQQNCLILLMVIYILIMLYITHYVGRRKLKREDF